MRRFCACLAALLMLFPWALAQEAAPEDGSWTEVLEGLAADAPDAVPPAWRIAVQENDLSPTEGLDKRVMNILLLSSDAEDISRNQGRTDLVILCSVHTETGRVRLISLPTDQCVFVAGLPQPIRLAYVNCFGGPLLTVKTVNEQWQLNISRYCAVNFSSFVSVVDRMGGVDLSLTADERATLGAPENAHLDGEQALRYVRLRQASSALDRCRKLLEALVRRAMDSGIDGAFDLIEAALPIIDTNLTTDNLVDLLFSVLGQETPADVTVTSLPAGEEIIPVHPLLYGAE